MAQKMCANSTAFAYLCEELNKRLVSQDELRDAVGISNATVVKWVRILKNRKLIYIAGWRRHLESTNWIRLWYWGYGMTDVPKPKASSNSENCKRYRRNKLQKLEKPLTETCI